MSETDTTDDAVLGGRLVLRQPRKGHRFGHDAILLAAATPAQPGEHAVDLGAGVGAAGLALARRVDGLRCHTGGDRSGALRRWPRHNAERNGLAERSGASVSTSRRTRRSSPRLDCRRTSADQVLMNPPFNPPIIRRRKRAGDWRIPHRPRRSPYGWPAAAAASARSEGGVTLIWRADGLDEVLAALAAHSSARLRCCRCTPKPRRAAIRVLVHAVADRAAGRRASLAGASSWPMPTARPARRAEAVLERARHCHSLD